MIESALSTELAALEHHPLLDMNVPARVAELAQLQPRALAARAEGIDLIWEDLERRSNAAARILYESFGPGPEAICLSGVTGTESAILPLAVVKSGRPYIWLDEELPLPRILQVVELSRTVGIAGTPSSKLAGAVGSMPVLKLDTAAGADQPPTFERSPEDSVSIVFTSGSTGMPKGVVTSHRYYLAHALAFAGRPVGSGHRVALVLPMSFAWGTIAYLRTLLLGGAVLFYDVKAAGLEGFADWLDGERVHALEATPSLMRSVVHTLAPGRVLAHLRMVDLGGEPVYGRDVAQLEEHVSAECAISNVIGSSELGSFCRYLVPRGVPHPGRVPVGTPEALYEVTVRDEEDHAARGGEPGEIVVTSRRCSSGYWAQPEQTAARFRKLEDGRTRYRTGDLGRWQEGDLVHLGRRDSMVKVRGYLVEPAEVEAALLDSGLVEECVVFGRDVEGEGGSIVAFVVPVAGQRVSAPAIRHSLRKCLPDYLMPSTVVLAEEFPRNPNGKIDRLALAEKPNSAGKTPRVLPRTPWEQAVWDMFAGILGFEDFGVNDDFFTLGGDSLAAEELVTALRVEYGATVDATDLVLAPTVASLAQRANWPRSRPNACVALRAEGNLPPLFCVAGGGGLAISFVPLVRYLPAGRPVYCLQNPAILGGGLPDWSVQAVARRYLKEVRALQTKAPYYLAGYSAGGVIAWEMAQQLARAGQRVGLLVMIDTPFPRWRRSLPNRLGRLPRDVWRICQAGLRPKRDGSAQYDIFFRHSQLLLRRYRPQPWGGATVVFASATSQERGHSFDWARLLTGVAETRVRPGDHFTIIREPHAEGFAQELEELLKSAFQAAQGPGVAIDDGPAEFTLQR